MSFGLKTRVPRTSVLSNTALLMRSGMIWSKPTSMMWS
jgi:hypothetical protein